eukprot:CAMPEP_0119275150 /NCGR_PEP_ID=MMETSP1329-20130426/13314_1 /TAXON_ID=114041 /ORGANISM="Genus nov. species nov., Strain RCC1024" /LENGTH=55 /DNA_ID=CAMNT_0007275513 /DNA_START=33 /DNA_END=196 /DNA_ORIENTATION=+
MHVRTTAAALPSTRVEERRALSAGSKSPDSFCLAAFSKYRVGTASLVRKRIALQG